jgi:N-methylhydantoinase A
MSFRVAIDTGGTFTDAISVNDKGIMVTAKTPTMPKDLAQGTINSIAALAKANDLGTEEFISQVVTIVHGTTQGTNVIITRTGPLLGLIATKGHRDVLQLRRVARENLFDWRKDFPEPLVSRYLRVEIEERVNSKGEIHIPLNEVSVQKAVSYLKEMGVKNIVVALLWSFLRPDHERRVRDIIKANHPEALITLSSDILPLIGEYERTSTAVISAYTAPSTADYIRTLGDFLAKAGFHGQFLFMQNNGGVETAEVGAEKPATLATSGPAAGPPAALAMGQLHNEMNLLSMDMGGTSFDCSIIDNGYFGTQTETLIADHRFSLPVVDVVSIGAGGGSIAWFDASHTLRVGPKSAAADPGPACYNKGGEEATVTDADVILGYISPDYFLGGEMKLNKELAEKVIKEKVADRLGISILEAAAAIYRIANSVMTDGLSHTFTSRGYDPRDFSLVAGGAAGPVCALRIAQDLNISRVFIPKWAPIYCAFGMLGVDLIHDFARFYHASIDELDLGHVKRLYEEMDKESLEVLAKEGIPENQRILERRMRLRYWGQFRDVEVSWPSGPITLDSIKNGIANFQQRHKELYGFSDEKYPVEFFGFSQKAIGTLPKLKLKEVKTGDHDASAALKGVREAYFEEYKGFVKTYIYNGDKLLSNNILEGPCIVEERITNVVIPPGFKMLVDRYGNYATTK